jgi:endonuclease/exonuclease/phosphatase family metal-dependent hydrolase
MRSLLQLSLCLIVGATPATVRAQASSPSSQTSSPSGPCAQAVDESGGPIAAARVTWLLRSTPKERRKLDAQCEALGPIVLRPAPHTSRSRVADTVDHITVVGWNVHVGGGDIIALVRQLESGALTGSPVGHYALLLQEVHRTSARIPAAPEGVRVPRRIEPRPATHGREDIVAIARRLDLSLYYVPSMRNGKETPFEDRGNAILSTLPLDDFTAIELPMARQRRVAISARIRGVVVAADDPAPTQALALQVNVVHLDALAGPKRLWIFATGWRSHQARAFLDHLDPRVPSVLAGDLNTWFLGRWEPAYRRFAHAFPETRLTTTPSGHRARGRLDAIFYRLPLPAASCTWIPRDPCGTHDARCGSDHRPLVGITPAAGLPTGRQS